MAITTRETTADGVTNKGAPLTNAEVDQNFIDLQQQKVDISALATTVRYFPTDTASGISTYTLMVDSLDDTEYDDTAVDIDTGAIDGSDVFIAGVVSEAETLSGNPGNINVQTIGNIRRTSGNAEAEFYFEVYHRDSGGTETLMGTSSNTAPVDSAIYVEFFADCLLDNPVAFTATDRVVIKYYGTKVGVGSDPSFDFQFGGTAPVRTNFPVPINVAVQDQDASQVQADTSNFDNALSGSDSTVQAALETLDDAVVLKSGDTMTGALNVEVNTSGDALRVTQTGSGNALVVEDEANPDSTPVVVNTNGSLIVGHTDSQPITGQAYTDLQVNGDSGTNGITISRFNDSSGPFFGFKRSKSSVIGTPQIVTNGSSLGIIQFFGDDGVEGKTAASISAEVDGSPSVGSIPGKISFKTTNEGENTSSEKVVIASSGNIGIGTSTPTELLDVDGNLTVADESAYKTTTQNLPDIRPSLNLDFANTKKLDPRIDFTRTTTATYYDGVTHAKAEENLFEYSQDFTQNWTNFGTTDSGNTTTAPDGTTTADTITEDSSDNVHRMGQIKTASGTLTLSVFAKAGAGSRYLTIGVNNSTANYASATFDLSAGTNTQTLVNGTYSNESASISASTEGFYRCSLTVTTDTISVAIIGLSATSTFSNGSRGSDSYNGDGSSSIILWGAQLEQRSSLTAYTPTTDQPITNYIPALQTAQNNQARFDHDPVTEESLGLLIEEQRTNLLTRSSEFDNAAWGKGNSSITANTIVAPDGTLTGDKFVEDTSTAGHSMFETVIVSDNAFITFTCYLKDGGRSRVRLEFYGAGGLGNDFDLSAGTVTVGTPYDSGTDAGGTITPVGNGWYRASLTLKTKSGDTSGTAQIRILDDSGTASYTGDGFSGVYIWGAQLEQGSFPTSYIPTSGSTATRNADSAEMTGTNFSSWYRQDAGTVYVEARSLITGTVNRIVSLNDGSTSNRIESDTGTLDDAIFRIRASGGTSLNPTISLVLTDFQPRKLAMAIQVNNYTFAANAETTSVTSALVPVVDRLMIGQSPATFNSSFLNGTIQKLAYYPKRLPDATLQALTEE